MSTHYASLEFGGFTVEYIHGLDAILNHTYRAVEETHEVTSE